MYTQPLHFAPQTGHFYLADIRTSQFGVDTRAYLMFKKIPLWLAITEFAKFNEFVGPITS